MKNDVPRFERGSRRNIYLVVYSILQLSWAKQENHIRRKEEYDRTNNEIVIAEWGRVAFFVQVFADRHLFLVVILRGKKNTSCARVEPQYVVYHPPHLWIQKAMNLTEDGRWIFSCPFESSAVSRHAEGHLGRENTDSSVIFRTNGEFAPDPRRKPS